MIMNEVSRQAYLKTMGIDSYFPRHVLPAAPVSKLCVLPESLQWATKNRSGESQRNKSGSLAQEEKVQESRVQESRTQEISTKEASLSAESLRKKLDLDSSIADSSRASESIKAPPQTTAESTQTVRSSPETVSTESAVAERASSTDKIEEQVSFKLALVCLNNGLFILNQLPAVGNGQFQNIQQTLLWRILKSLGLDLKGEDLTIHLFAWPSGLPGIENTRQAAQSTLRTFLETNSHNSKLETLLLMGDALLADLFQVGEEHVRGKVTTFEPLNCKVLLTYSLDQMLKVSSLKGEFWKDVSVLRHSIS